MTEEEIELQRIEICLKMREKRIARTEKELPLDDKEGKHVKDKDEMDIWADFWAKGDKYQTLLIVKKPDLAYMLRNKQIQNSVEIEEWLAYEETMACLLYTSPSPRDKRQSRMPSSA